MQTTAVPNTQNSSFSHPVASDELSPSDLYRKAKVAYAEGTVPAEIQGQTLASMKAVLLKAIKETSLTLIQNSRERLKRQYKLAREEMERIEQKGRR